MNWRNQTKQSTILIIAIKEYLRSHTVYVTLFLYVFTLILEIAFVYFILANCVHGQKNVGDYRRQFQACGEISCYCTWV